MVFCFSCGHSWHEPVGVFAIIKVSQITSLISDSGKLQIAEDVAQKMFRRLGDLKLAQY